MNRFIINHKVLTKFLVVLLWLLIWQVAAVFSQGNILMVSPVKTMACLYQLAFTMVFWQAILFSLFKIAVGFFLAVVVGTVLAVLSVYKPFVAELLSPLFLIIRATPVVSFAILALLFFRSSGLTIFISFLMVVPIVYGDVTHGIVSIDKNLVEMVQLFELPFLRQLRVLYIPSVLPYLLVAAKSGLGFAFKSGISAEVIGLPDHSIGQELYLSKLYLQTDVLFAYTLAIVLLSVALEKIFVWLMKKVSV